MILSTEVLKAIETFLTTVKEDGVIQNYSLQYQDTEPSSDQVQIHFIEAFSKFADKVNDLKVQMQINESSPKGLPMSEEQQSENDVNKTENDLKFVQIRVDKKGVDRRINAFINRKRKEVNEWNVQEFCSRPALLDESINYDNYTSCARVDAIFVPRSGSKSHVKVSKVTNQWGPQVSLASPCKMQVSANVESKSDALPDGIEERLRNMETHLKLKSGSSMPSSIYARLKDLEDRILYLEGMSPDYFSTTRSNINSITQKDKLSKYADWSIEEIDNRIQILKDKLKEQYQANNDV